MSAPLCLDGGPAAPETRAAKGLRRTAAALALASLGGCCTIAGWFCGPDRSRWVSQRYETPDAALTTFLEAIRRDRPDVVCESLSERAKQNYGLAGVLECAVAWERMKAEVPGLHLAGDAERSELEVESDGRRRCELHAAGGNHITVLLREQPYWELTWLGRDGDLRRAGRFVSESEFRALLAVGGDLEVTVDARVTDELLPTLEPARIRSLQLGHEWKIDDIEGLPGQ